MPARNMSDPCRRLAASVLALASLLVAGCDQQQQDLVLEDLTADERLYVERVIVLERAKAVALNDREIGHALLDSLAAAWGDSSLPETTALVPQDPIRSAAVANLLMRLLTAEEDSLLHAPRVDRLTAPLPQPVEPLAKDQPG